MKRIVLSKLVIYFFVILAENKTGEGIICTDSRCTCFPDKENITAVCRMSDLGSIASSFSRPSDINALNVSSNKITAIDPNTFEKFPGLISLELSQNMLEGLLANSFSGLKKLRNLSLTYNNIQVIHKDAFSGLHSLEILNLTGNNLQTWNTHGSSLDLPSLITIDVQGNMEWRPEDKSLLELPGLKEIRNVSWAAECLDCWLVRNASEHLIEIFNKSYYQTGTNPVTCFVKHYKFSNYLKFLARQRFVLKKCRRYFDCISQREGNVTTTMPCWYLNKRAVSAQLVLGIIGVILNLTVFFNILLTKTLRRNVSLVLVSNLSLGDTLICMYSAIMAAFAVSNEYEELYEYPSTFVDEQCPRLGSLWLLGQCVISITSVALTLERYLCIVFSMKPDIRMTPRLAFLAISFNWVVAVFMTSMAHYLDIYRRNMLCVPVTYDMSLYPKQSYFTVAMGATGITFYVVTIPLYIHIYRVVKKSSQQMGVQRESTLAKRIAVLVGTNLVFFFMPVLLLGAWSLVIKAFAGLQSIHTRGAIELWIPQFCLIVNSCLNPLVHAFRNDKFKNALKKNLPIVCNKSNATAPAVQNAPNGRNARSYGNVTPAVQAATSGGARDTGNATSSVQTASSGVSSTVTPAAEAASSGGVAGTSSVTPAKNFASSKV